MGKPLMATVARRDYLFGSGGVAYMTIQASEFVAMGHAVSLNGGDDLWVAFVAIAKGEGFCCCGLFVDWLHDGFIGGEAREV